MFTCLVLTYYCASAKTMTTSRICCLTLPSQPSPWYSHKIRSCLQIFDSLGSLCQLGQAKVLTNTHLTFPEIKKTLTAEVSICKIVRFFLKK